MIAVINVVSYCVDKEFLHKISAEISQLKYFPVILSHSVALQFPEGLLIFACTIADILERLLAYVVIM